MLRNSNAAAAKVKKKLTKEQMQLAIIKKKECDAKALSIVEQLLEPKIDPVWLVENLKHINKCHMEDVIEERAIIKICGYVLCQKPLTVIIKQKYHISLKDKKVYDVSKRKNFCSSSCFGASNYLLEQMLTSPLWMRDKEEIPNFKIFTKETLMSHNCHGKEMDINIVERFVNDNNKMEEVDSLQKEESSEGITVNQIKEENYTDEMVTGDVKDFVFETFKNINLDFKNSNKNSATPPKKNEDSSEKDDNLVINHDQNKPKEHVTEKINEESIQQCNLSVKSDKKAQNVLEKPSIENNVSDKLKKEIIQQCVHPNSDKNHRSIEEDTDVIEQFNYLTEKSSNETSLKQSVELNHQLSENENSTKEGVTSLKCDKTLINNKSEENSKDILKQSDDKLQSFDSTAQADTITNKATKTISKKLKSTKKRKETKPAVSVHVNLAKKIEKSIQEWITNETVNFLFGDETIKKRAIQKIERQDRYNMLCQKLNRLQFEDEQEDADILKKPVLKPAPHYAVLKEEGQKLDIKVRAFYQGKATYEEYKNTEVQEDDSETKAFLPLTDTHAPQTLRRKIFLERLDQVLPDLLRTLAGNNEVNVRTCCNYTSMRCSAIKALVNTFSLSATNIIFKSAEWTLVGLVIIKMLSFIDSWLANLLITKQANMYISMILTSYKLEPHYLNLFVNSFNPNMNPK